MAVFHCPTCDITKQVPEKHSGREVRCPKCGTPVMIVPDEAEHLPEPPAPEASIEHVDVSDLAGGEQQSETAPPPPVDEEDARARGLSIGEKVKKIDPRGGIFQGRLVGNVTSGLLLGLLTFFLCLAFAVLIFPGTSGPLYMYAVTMALTAGAVTGIVAAFGSGFPVAVAGPESAAGAILFLMVGGLWSEMSGNAPDEAVFATLSAAVSLSAVAAGLGLLAVGVARAGTWTRYIPYQVIGGIMAGVGFTMLKGVYVFSAGAESCLLFEGDFLGREFLQRLGPAFALGVILFTARGFFRHPIVLLVIIIAAVGAGNAAIHYGLLPYMSYETCTMGAMEPFRFWYMYSPEFLSLVRWDLIVDSIPYMLALIGVVTASLMLKVMGMELEAGTESGMDRELKAIGTGSLLSGLAGGMPGSLSRGRSLGARRFGAQGPLAGILSGLVCALGLVFAGRILPYIPWFVPAGLLVFMGLGLMYRWLVETRSEFTQPGDYSVLLLIFLLIAALGFLPGVAVGAALAMMVLVVRYGSVDVVRHVLFGDHHRSNVDRAPYQLKILHQKGGRIMIMRLQGFLFLGTTNSLIRRIRKRASDKEREPLRYIILDFTRISGLDSSVCLSFRKLRSVAGQYGATLIFTNVPFEMEQQLELGGCVLNSPDEGSLTFVSVDYAMEWCENRILESEGAQIGRAHV